MVESTNQAATDDRYALVGELVSHCYTFAVQFVEKPW